MLKLNTRTKKKKKKRIRKSKKQNDLKLLISSSKKSALQYIYDFEPIGREMSKKFPKKIIIKTNGFQKERKKKIEYMFMFLLYKYIFKKECKNTISWGKWRTKERQKVWVARYIERGRV